MNDMNYNEFQNHILENIRRMLPPDYADAEISIDHVFKLGASYDALTIRKPGEEGSPALSVNQMFQAYQQGEDLNSILHQVSEVYSSFSGLNLPISDVTDYEMIKDRLFIRLSNAETNREMLKDIPHTQVEDLAITYHVSVSNPGDKELASFTVNDALMKSYGITKEELHRQALNNSPKIMPPVLKTLHSALAEEMDIPAPNSIDPQIYLLTNKFGINGAACLMYDHAMEEASKIIGGDYIVLPSSIHEVLLIKDDGKRDYESLKHMVQEINRMSVKPEEQLAETVYHYDAKTNKLETPEEFIARVSQEQGPKLQPTTLSASHSIDTQKPVSTIRSFKMKF